VTSLLVEISLTFLFIADINRSGLLHLFTLTELIILATVFVLWQSHRWIRVVFMFGVLIYTLFWVSAKTFLENVERFDSYSSSLSAVILICMALVTLYDMITSSYEAYTKDPRFWFATAVLLYFSGNILNFALFNSIFVWRLHMALNIIHNLLFAGVFLCRRPQQS
jgi:hypothetical protein